MDASEKVFVPIPATSHLMNIHQPQSVDYLMKTLLTLILFGLMTKGVFAQTSTETGNTNAVSVNLWVPPADLNLQAPAAIRLVASVSTSVPSHPGDTIKVNFLANSKYLGSAVCTWHEGHQPDPKSHTTQPMIIIPPGYSAAQWVWKHVPAGTYSLMATVIGGNGFAAYSPPVQVTVKP